MGDIQVNPVLIDPPVEAPTAFIVNDIPVVEAPTVVQIDFPEIIIVEQLSSQGRANLATSVPLVKQIVSQNTNGAIYKEGKWDKNPGGEWPIEKLGVGQYKVTHNWGYFNLSLSVSIGLSRGTAQVVENSPTYFTVNTYVDGVLTDAPFVFTLSKVISPG